MRVRRNRKGPEAELSFGPLRVACPERSRRAQDEAFFDNFSYCFTRLLAYRRAGELGFKASQRLASDLRDPGLTDL
jgi:hypothetical protein